MAAAHAAALPASALPCAAGATSLNGHPGIARANGNGFNAMRPASFMGGEAGSDGGPGGGEAPRADAGGGGGAAGRDEVIESLFDPDVSGLVAELEGGPLALSDLAARSGVAPEEVDTRLSRLVELGYVSRRADPSDGSGGGAVYEADAAKLAAVMESDENYQSAVDGMTKLDGFLN